MDRETQTLIAARSVRRLIRLQNPDGSFLYKYDPAQRRKASGEYNIVRHAGCAYAMAWAFSRDETKCEAGLEWAVRLAIRYLIGFLKEYRGQLYVSELNRDVGNLGATALLSCALSFEPFRREYADVYRGLYGSLLNAQRNDGSFVCKFNAPTSLPEEGQNYYPGETLLALARYLESGLDYPIPNDLVRRSFEYYRRQFRSAPHTGMILWHADAWTRIYRWHKSKRVPTDAVTSDYLDFAVELVEWIIPFQLRSPTIPEENVGGFCLGLEPGVATAGYVEAVLRVRQAIDSERQDDRPRDYEPHIGSGTEFVSRLHFSVDCFGGDHSHWTLGGTPMSLTRRLFRMDSDQHVITMCLSALELT
jgi:hypothetical protein